MNFLRPFIYLESKADKHNLFICNISRAFRHTVGEYNNIKTGNSGLVIGWMNGWLDGGRAWQGVVDGTDVVDVGDKGRTRF